MSSLNGEIITCDQHADGQVQLRIFGDEFYARYETPEGFTVVYDKDLGCYCYAQLALGRLVSSGVLIGKPIPVEIPRHLKEHPDVRNEKFGRRYARLRPPEPDADASASRTFAPDDGLLNGRKLFRGNIRGLTILVEFDDITTTITNADVQEMFNGDDYRRNGNFCSVREYFRIVSDGRLDYTNTVVGPVKLSKRRSHYISNLLVKEALDIAVDDFNIDLADFDSRDDGVVDAINFLYAGESQYSGDLWPHNSVRTLQYGSMQTHFYQLTGVGAHRVDLRIGTICHENGHLLCRFPDMYDYGKRDGDHEKSQGIGRYCLMGSGNHLNDRRTPSPVCGYLRDLAGWADNVVLLNAADRLEAAHGDYGTVMKYETNLPNEYFVIENRLRMGLDSHLPSSGLAIYHCDTLGSNEWQDGTRNRHYQCALLQADGHLDLENNRNTGDEGDLFPTNAGVVVSHDTNPASRMWSSADSGLIVSEIAVSGETIGFTTGVPDPSNVAHGGSDPNLIIPDHNDRGISSTIQIAATGKATTISARVEIIHPWIGDLRVILKAPDGTEAVLHNREGRDGDDIMTTYLSADVDSMAVLVGKNIEGSWTLTAIDMASRDVGRLLRWSIEIGYEPSMGIVEGSANPELEIPDANPQGVTSAIPLHQGGIVKEMTVDVDIEHTYIGDLEIDLMAPSGSSARLHNKTGGTRNNIKRLFSLASTPALQSIIGQPVEGDWKLQVRDLASRDVGTLKSWSIHIKY